MLRTQELALDLSPTYKPFIHRCYAVDKNRRPLVRNERSHTPQVHLAHSHGISSVHTSISLRTFNICTTHQSCHVGVAILSRFIRGMWDDRAAYQLRKPNRHKTKS